MLDALLRWVARLLAGILERYGDPSLQAKLDAFNARVAEVDKRAKEAEQLTAQLEAAYRESAARRDEWQRQINDLVQQEATWQQRVKSYEDRIQELKSETVKKHLEIDSLSDADAIRGNPV